MGPFAHSNPEAFRDCTSWEPLFTPQCPALGVDVCEACETLNRRHMFPPGSKDAKAAREWGYLVGLWHGLGKFADDWQRYLATKADSNIQLDEVVGTVDHSTAGAQFSEQSIPKFGRLLAYLIAGHHPGLANGEDRDAPQSSLRERLKKVSRDTPVASQLRSALAGQRCLSPFFPCAAVALWRSFSASFSPA